MQYVFGFGPSFLAKDFKTLGISCKVSFFFSTNEMTGDWVLLQLQHGAGSRCRDNLRVENLSPALTFREGERAEG